MNKSLRFPESQILCFKAKATPHFLFLFSVAVIMMSHLIAQMKEDNPLEDVGDS